MEDKFLMEELLFGNKVITDLYLHGFIESSNEQVRDTFSKALNESLKNHTEIYEAMKNAGFYQVKDVEESKIKQTKTKLESSVKCAKNEE